MNLSLEAICETKKYNNTMHIVKVQFRNLSSLKMCNSEKVLT